jgi:hypothetical protein
MLSIEDIRNMAGFAFVFVSVGEFLNDGWVSKKFLKPGNKWDITKYTPW